MYFTQLSDSFAKFFGKNYEISGYELTKENTKHLNDIKTYYRLSVVISIFSFIASSLFLTSLATSFSFDSVGFFLISLSLYVDFRQILN